MDIMNAIEKFELTKRPFTEEEWPDVYMRVVSDPRFQLFGLTVQDIVYIKFHLDCWKKTPQDLKADVP